MRRLPRACTHTRRDRALLLAVETSAWNSKDPLIFLGRRAPLITKPSRDIISHLRGSFSAEVSPADRIGRARSIRFSSNKCSILSIKRVPRRALDCNESTSSRLGHRRGAGGHSREWSRYERRAHVERAVPFPFFPVGNLARNIVSNLSND